MNEAMMHLVLAIRPARYLPYRIEGDDESRIECYHASARHAETAIITYCREHRRTATVRVYTPRNHLWSKLEIASDGTVTGTLPTRRMSPGGRAGR